MGIDQHVRGEAPEILSWRRGQLLAAGFATALATRVARDPAFDLHELIELTEGGCPPDLAVRILAPLDDQEVG